MTLDWSGLYRVEGVAIKNSELSSTESTKNYIQHHLVLRPKIVAADGLTIHSRLDLFNNTNIPNSQFGQFFGSGIGDGTPTSSDDSNVLSQNEADETLNVTELYATYDFEFGALVIGRVPLQFGLGMTHNGGKGLFDHYFDTRDVVGYKFAFGNLTLLPMYAKVDEGQLDVSDDVREWITQLDYRNDETDTAFGLYFAQRNTGRVGGNDAPTTIGVNTYTLSGGFNVQDLNFYYKSASETFSFGLEGGLRKGKTGLAPASGGELSIDALGIATEFDWTPSNSKWKWRLRAGYASGDDASTAEDFEGFAFDRNYDVGLLLFNHRLGQFDALGSSSFRNDFSVGGATQTPSSPGSDPDVESLTNAFFVVPGFERRIGKKWTMGFDIVWAQLVETNAVINNTVTEIDSDLGLEFDIRFTFKPHDKFTWTSGIGVLSPGSAFEGGSNGFETDTVYGITTQAAITF